MAVDIFCKIDGIDGESTDDKHKKWIECQNYSHGVAQPLSSASRTGGRTGGRADFENFSITKTIDSATPDLNVHCCNGKHIPKVEVECCLATEDKHCFMKYEMEDVIVSSVAPNGSASSDDVRPAEQLSLAYGKIKWECTPIDQKGSPGAAVTRGWDLETNMQV